MKTSCYCSSVHVSGDDANDPFPPRNNLNNRLVASESDLKQRYNFRYFYDALSALSRTRFPVDVYTAIGEK